MILRRTSDVLGSVGMLPAALTHALRSCPATCRTRRATCPRSPNQMYFQVSLPAWMRVEVCSAF